MRSRRFAGVLSTTLLVGVLWFAARRYLFTPDESHEQGPDAIAEKADSTAANSPGDNPARSVIEVAMHPAVVPPAAAQPPRPRVPTYAEKAALAEDPDLREFVTRRIEKDYAALFAKLHLPRAKEEALSMILVDRIFAPEISEMEGYDRLAAELLGPADYAEFAAYRDELPIKNEVEMALKVMAKDSRQEVPASVATAVEKVVRSAPRNGDAIWMDADSRIQQGGVLSESDIAALANTAMRKFEDVLSREAAALSEPERERLREWFAQNVVQFHVRAFRNARPPGG